MNRTINEYVAANWERIRSDLAMEGTFVTRFEAGRMVGEGYFNEGMYGAGSTMARYSTTSHVRLRIRLSLARILLNRTSSQPSRPHCFRRVGMVEIPEPLRRRMMELENQDALETVRSFVAGYFSDAESFEEVEGELRSVAEYSTRSIVRNLRALEEVLNRQLAPGVAARLVGWDGNWVLDDPSDAGALEFLRQVADMLRSILADFGPPPILPAPTNG
jgi:hypothetical protein